MSRLPTPAKAPPSEPRATIFFLIRLILIVFLFRSFIVTPFSIPSESMLPRLLVGDYLFVTKWNYGYSKHSFPWSLPLIEGRIFAKLPERGQVVVFKAPPTNNIDYIKRVIGLPGDQVQLRGGQVILNGVGVPRARIADFTVPVTPNYRCREPYLEAAPDGGMRCRYTRYLETLPSGRSYQVLDHGLTQADDTQVFVVPENHLFLMGDNRDASADSRYPAEAGGGIGFVPFENIEGPAALSFFSTDGSAEWLAPWTWFSAARWERIGEGF